jgi:LacI family transcriptional regulator
MKTVSRVLNNEAHVRPALRDKVLKAVSELDYKPNLAARQLAANRSFLISFIMHDITTSYTSQIVVSAANECRRHGYHLISEPFEEGDTGMQVVERVTGRLRPDGIILSPPLCNDEALVAAVERLGTPLARLAGTGDLYGTAITVHERDVTAELVRHLIGLGHRRVAMIAPPWEHGAARERVAGYHDALASEGLPSDPDLVVAGDFSFRSGVEATGHLLALHQRPTAIFAANDGMALGAMALARQMGLAIPDDVAIAGFDDSPGSRMVFPPLTTVRQPIAQMARAAVAAILGHEMADTPLRHELLLRGSTTGSPEIILSEVDA